MKRAAMAKMLLALTLVLALPFDQALCAPTGVPSRAAVCGRACCQHHSACAASHAKHAAARACDCRLAPQGTMPVAAAPAAPAASSALFMVAVSRDLPLPISPERVIAPPLRLGSPPLPAALGAHLLRAPPVSA